MIKKFLILCIIVFVVGCGSTNDNACCPNSKNCICSVEDNKKV